MNFLAYLIVAATLCKLGASECLTYYTDYESDGGGSSRYFDRHNVICPSNKVISQFQLQRDSSKNEIRFAYLCCDANINSTCTNSSTSYRFNEGGVVYLDRQTVSCPTGQVLQRFQYSREGSKENWRYDYTCCAVTTIGTCAETYTEYRDDGHGSKGDSNFLDRHNVVCSENGGLQMFKLERNSGKDEIRYKYQCCSIPYQLCSAPVDKMKNILSCHAASYVEISCSYTLTTGCSQTWTNSSGTYIDTTVGATVTAGLQDVFETSIGVSVTTGFDWTYETSTTFTDEVSTSAAFNCPAYTTCELRQVVGYCGTYSVSTNYFRLDAYSTTTSALLSSKIVTVDPITKVVTVVKVL